MMFLSITLAALVVVTWLYSMYITWKATTDVPLALVESAPFLAKWHQGARLTRRGWYQAESLGKRAVHWGTGRAQKALVRFFPDSAAMFVKHDKLTGLTHGPSSYFLKTITPAPKAPARRLPRAKRGV